MADTFRYLLGPHGVFEGTPEEVQARGFDPWQSQLFTGVYNRGQFGNQAFDWSGYGLQGGQDLGLDYSVGYLPTLLDWRAGAKAGTLKDYEREQYEQWVKEAQAIPLRDVSALTYDAGTSGTGQTLSGASPDLGGLMLRLADRIDAGEATDQERSLFQTTERALRDQNWRASVPQASDAFNPLGDNLFSALGVLGLGATGGLAAAPLFAGGAGLATTLGSLGTLAGVAGTGASTLGSALQQPWLQQAGLGLGIAGGLAGGLGGLSNLWSSGVNSLSDAARLAQSAGKITGSLGRIPGAEPLKDVSRYLGYAGQAGQFGAGVGADDWLGWSGTNSPLAANVAPQMNSNVSNLLSAADMATQRGGGNVADFDYSWDYGGSAPYDNWSWDAGAIAPGSGFTPDYSYDYGGQQPYDNWSGSGGAGGLSLEEQVRQGIAGRPDLYGSASTPQSSSLWGTLGSLGSGALKMLLGGAGGGTGAGALGPLLASLGSVGGGAIGSNAANEAARLQAAALNRGIDLSEAQWLQQQARTQPWVQAGQQALGTLQGLAGQQLPGLPGATPSISGANYALPGTTPGWSPQAYQGPQGPNAADYRYSAPATVNPANYAWNPQAAMDPSQYSFSAPSGQEVLNRDPGYQFRQTEARRALEGSAAARGDLMSGGVLQALQSRSQDLASQEYQNAYGRALGENQLRYGRGLTQTQEDYQRQLQANQLGYGRATEQQQLGYQQGLGAQGFNWQTALQGQQNQFNQGITAQQWEQQQQQAYETDMYNRMLEQSKLRYSQDVSQNTTDYERAQNLYKQQLSQSLLPFEQNSVLASLGGQMAGQLGSQGIQSSSGISNLLGQLGSAQAGGATNQANSWMNALQNVGNAGQGYLQQNALLSALSNLNA